MDFVSLPEDLLGVTYKYLSLKDASRLCGCCKSLYSVWKTTYTALDCSDHLHVRPSDVDRFIEGRDTLHTLKVGSAMSGDLLRKITNQFQDLRVLSISRAHVKLESLYSIASCASLEQLDISWIQVWRGMTAAVHIWSHCRQLRELDVSGMHLAGVDYDTLPSSGSPHLHTVIMRGIDWDVMKCPLPWFASSVRTLDLGMCTHTTSNMRSDIFERCPQLRHLNLDRGRTDLTAIDTLVRRCPLLETLSIRDVVSTEHILVKLHPLQYLRSVRVYVRNPLPEYRQAVISAFPPQIEAPTAAQLSSYNDTNAVPNSMSVARALSGTDYGAPVTASAEMLQAAAMRAAQPGSPYYPVSVRSMSGSHANVRMNGACTILDLKLQCGLHQRCRLLIQKLAARRYAENDERLSDLELSENEPNVIYVVFTLTGG